MYEIKKKKSITKEIKIMDDDKERIFTVNFYLDDIISKYNELRRLIGEADRQVGSEPSEISYENLGQAVVELLRLLFGDEQASQIVEMYEQRYIELLVDFAPFIMQEIQPEIDKAINERAKVYDIK